jgi:hypothetical protein
MVNKKKLLSKVKLNKPKVGAPNKLEKEIKQPDGFSNEQREWLRDEANARNVTVAFIKREALDWYISAKEKARDNVPEELLKSSNNE